MLTERQLLILQVIVDDYIRYAEPVGSRSISKREGVAFSAATIRNEMADLEELGYIEKPHSSSGRIPSQKGYRFYVDHLLLPHQLTEEELQKIRSLYEMRIEELEEVIQHTAKILSQVTSYISVVLGPELLDTKLRHVQIISLSKTKAVVIIVLDTGQVENYLITMPEGIAASELEKIANILNERLKGLTLNQVRKVINQEIGEAMKAHVKNYQAFLDVINRALESHRREKVFYSGKTNLLTQPEFRDVEKVRSIYSYLEEEKLVQKLFRSNQSGVQVKIGQENELEAFQNCSIITATYSIGDNKGTIGILGPTRMEYDRVISIVDYLSKKLTEALTNLYQRD